MLFLIAFAGASMVAGLLRREDSLRDHVRRGLGIAMAVAGVAHLAMPAPFIQHLPEWVPARPELIAFTGFVELGLGAALFVQARWRELAGLVLAAYLVAVFPANVYVAVQGIEVDGQPGGLYPWLRLPFQALFVAAAVWSTQAPGIESATKALRTAIAGRFAPAR